MALENVDLIEQFIDSLWLEKGLSENTLSAYRTDLTKFIAFAEAAFDGFLLQQMSKDDIEFYLAHRYDIGLSERSTARFLSSLRMFCRYILQKGLRKDDPMRLLQNPKLPQPLPKTLSEDQVDALLSAPNVDNPIELRDKAMLEVLYATGLRVSELVGLRIGQLGLQQGVVRV